MSTFQFKQFNIHQDKCAMKVGTDGVLLGAWTPINNQPFSVLDIGAGTGLIALMLAQRTNAGLIDALEVEDNAYEQAVENFENSPWGDRLFCYHAGLDEFTDEMQDEEKYDLIVSNPPFYSEDYTSGNTERDKARFSFAMPFEELVESASLLLNREYGVFAVVIPYKEEENFIKIAQGFSLHPYKVTRVKGAPETEIKRSLIAFQFQKPDTIIEDELVIETARHQYTPEYTALTKDFYLKM